MMQQLQQQQNKQQGDAYEKPSSQIVHLTGKSCVEVISLPMIQNYYTNVELFNKEYGYYTINFAEFPMNDSLLKTIGPILELNVKIEMEFAKSMLSAMQTFEDPDSFIAGLRETYFIANVQIETSKIRSIEELVQLLNIKLAAVAQKLGGWVYTHGERSLLPSSGGPLEFFLFFHSFDIDPVTKKFICKFGKPTQYDGIVVPLKMKITIYGSQEGRAKELCIAMFGGIETTGPDPQMPDRRWESSFDTGHTNQFLSWLIGGRFFDDIPFSTTPTEPNEYDFQNIDFTQIYPSIMRGVQFLVIHGTNAAKLYVDPYLYIRGAPEASIWNPDGSSTDLVMVIPRNKGFGQPTDSQSFVSQQGHVIKTSLASLRNMTLRFTDSQNRLLLIDEPYLVDFIIKFKE